MITGAKKEIEEVQKILRHHRRIVGRVEEYSGLVRELLYDLEAIENKSLYYIIDFSFLFPELFPVLTRNLHYMSEADQLKEAAFEQCIMGFFFNLKVHKVLLRVYAEEFKAFYAREKKSALTARIPELAEFTDLSKKLEEKYVFFDLLLSKLRTCVRPSEISRRLAAYYAHILDAGEDRFTELIQKGEEMGLMSLTSALGDQALTEPLTTDEFETLRQSDIKYRSEKVIESDVRALSLVRALNDEFGGAAPEPKSFIFVTRDFQILRYIKELRLDVNLPSTATGDRDGVTFCRSLDHLTLLYVCCKKYGGLEDPDFKSITEWLEDRRENIETYLHKIDEIQNWLQMKVDEDRDPSLKENLEGVYGRIERPDPQIVERLAADIESYLADVEDRDILELNYRRLVDRAFSEEAKQLIEHVDSPEDVKRALEQISKDIADFDLGHEISFADLERVKEKLDVIIARVQAPILNRYRGFRYSFAAIPSQHKFKEQLTEVSEQLGEESPNANAVALELLYKLAREEEGEFHKDGYFTALLSKAYRLQGLYYNSISICDRAFFWEAKNVPEVFFEQALSLRAKGKIKKAKQCLEKANKLAPRDLRYSQELATLIWRPIMQLLHDTREALKKKGELKRQLFYSHPAVISVINEHRNEIKKARRYTQAEDIDLLKYPEKWQNLSHAEKSLFVRSVYGTAYFNWLLALKPSHELKATDPQPLRRTLAAVGAALDSYEEVPKTMRCRELIYLHTIATRVRIQLTLCEIAALNKSFDSDIADILEKLADDVSRLECIKGFEREYECITQEYSKFQSIHDVYHRLSSGARNQ